MNVLLIYYTGTFNTRKLSFDIKDRFCSKKNTVELLEITKDKEAIDTSSFDLIGLGYPIYGFNSPKPFNEYLRKLSFNEKQKFFIYKDSGETLSLNNSSSRVIFNILKKFKMQFIGEYHYVMPYNIRFPYDDSFIKEILIYDEKLMDIMFYNFEHHLVHKIKSNLKNNLVSRVLAIQKIGGSFNSFFYKVDNDKCIKCKKCIDNCPNNNIYLKDGKIKFHHDCDMCMRCSYYCPEDAIKIGILNKWKVTNYFDFAEIEKKEYKTYINKDSKGFYKCFIKTFKEIDELHQNLFKK